MYNTFVLKFKKVSFIIIIILHLSACGEKKSNVQDNHKSTIKEEKKDNGKEGLINSKTILFFGNSLTAGYGLDPEESYPAIIQYKIDSLNLNYKVINAGISGETSSTGKNRIDWLLKQKVDVFVLELGANDGLRGLPVKETKKNLKDIIDAVENNFPDAKIILAGMQIPPNMGADYSKSFNTMFKEIATEEKITLIPFLLESVGGEARLNQEDGIHPTAEGQKIVAENVWRILKDLL